MNIQIQIEGLDELLDRLQRFGGIHGVQARVGNDLGYAPFVGSSRFQAGIHRGRWTTDEQAIQLEEDEIRKDFQTAVDAGLKARTLRINPLRVAAEAAVLRLQTRMATYPAARSSSRYRRTGTYGRSWTTTIQELSK